MISPRTSPEPLPAPEAEGAEAESPAPVSGAQGPAPLNGAAGRVFFETVAPRQPGALTLSSIEPRLTLAALPAVSVGLRVKLVGLMLAMISVIVTALTSYSAVRAIGEGRHASRERALVYASLASKQLRSAVAFADRETAREVLSALANDAQIDGITVYGASGQAIYAEGQRSELAKRVTRAPGNGTMTFQLPGRILAVAPVLSMEGVKGSVVLELSTRAATELRNRMVLTSALLGAAALILGGVLASLIARSIARRIELVAAAASKMARGDLEHALELEGPHDEIGILIRTFNAMSAKVSELVAHIRESAQDENSRLERLVSHRTEELHRRNGDLRLVLDMVEQGLVVIDAEARPLGEYSLSIERWLGPLRGDSTLWHQLTRSEPAREEAFVVAWEQVQEQLLPLEFTLAQLPRGLVLAERHLSFEYRAVQQQSLDKVLVVISDVTALVARAEGEQEAREMLSITRSLLNEREAFLEFYADGKRLVARINQAARSTAELARDLHTLKGNAGLFGLSRVAAVCHDLESSLLEGAAATASELERLQAAWAQCEATVEKLVTERNEATLEISRAEHGAVMAGLARGMPPAELAHWVGSWGLEPLRVRLERAALQLTRGAERLGKGRASVNVRASRTFFAREELSEFWSAFVHVVRNAVVYGLRELDDAERVAAQARGLPDFELEGGLQDDVLFVELRDFGVGVDWEAIRARAQASGLPHDTQAELELAMFSDGVSSREGVNEFAGRGVGLGAVRAACLLRRGVVSVRAPLGGGSSFRFSWPTSALPSLVHLDAERAS